MSILKVARMGHPVLRAPARVVDPSELRTPAVQQLIDDLTETMRECRGIGLAAPQVHHSLRLFVAGQTEDVTDEERLPFIVLVNPEIRPIGSRVVEDWEGCLSIPDIRGRVPRAYEVEVRGLDRHGRRITLTAAGFAARVIQHETDHLDGILFLDQMTSFESLTFLDEYSRFSSREETPTT